jgi:adenine-specific DNA-methyltransferase
MGGISTISRSYVKLQHIKEKSLLVNDTSSNYVIHGDNLEVMNLLKDTRLNNSIDCMIWDPPYNTKRHDLGYKDDHDNWADFMIPRLNMAKELLKESGNIAVHINYKCLFKLANIMDSVFGEYNRKGIINWENCTSIKNAAKDICSNTDYILIYAKNKKKSFIGLLPRTKAMNDRYNKIDSGGSIFKSDDLSGVFAKDNLTCTANKQSNRYGVQNPLTKKIYYPSLGRDWRLKQTSILEALNQWGTCELIDGCYIFTDANIEEKALRIQNSGNWPRIYFGNTGTTGPALKRYLHELKKNGRGVGTFWKPYDTTDIEINLSLTNDISGHNGEAKHAYLKLMESCDLFMTPKPLKITKTLLEILSPSDGIVLDAFAGSGTVGHAVFDMNIEGSNRSFILIENEDYCDHILAERLRRVAKIAQHECCNFNYCRITEELYDEADCR